MSFGVWNCDLTTVKMTCRNWVVKSGKEDANKGRVNWREGLATKFWWFDARQYIDNADVATAVAAWSNSPDAFVKEHKAIYKDVTLLYDAGTSAAVSMVQGAAAFVAMAIFVNF